MVLSAPSQLHRSWRSLIKSLKHQFPSVETFIYLYFQVWWVKLDSYWSICWHIPSQFPASQYSRLPGCRDTVPHQELQSGSLTQLLRVVNINQTCYSSSIYWSCWLVEICINNPFVIYSLLSTARSFIIRQQIFFLARSRIISV